MIRNAGRDCRRDIIAYGLNLLINEMICTVMILTLGFITGNMVESIVYLACLIVGTGTMGGYHCNSRKCCFLLTIILWWISITLLPAVCQELTIGYAELSCILFAVVVWGIAPVENRNKLLHADVRRKNMICARSFSAFLTIMIIILWPYDQRLACFLWINWLELVISMLTAFASGRKGGKCRR